MRGVLIAAPSSGSGKTVAVMGLLALLKRKGLAPVVFKCGPDYIDPMFHRRVLEVDSCNLDSFFLPADEVRSLAERTIAEQAGEEGIGVVEGVMGYFDGLGGRSVQGSSCEMAEILDVPAVLVVDGRGASLSLTALIQGFLNYVPQGKNAGPSRIAGVILNRVSPGMYPLLKDTIESELPVRCLGYVPRLEWLSIESRHLGLVLPDEIGGLKAQVDRLAAELESTLDWRGIAALAEKQGKQRERASRIRKETLPPKLQNGLREGLTFRLGVALDEAFCFYYRENLRALEAAGAKLCYFSPIHDSALPADLDGLLLGGGYPELHAAALAENETMRRSVLLAAEAGMPMLAECGGYLYLLEELEGGDGRICPMAGVFEGSGRRERKLRQFGYISVTAGEDGIYLKRGETVRGHEFHYWHCALDREEAVMEAVKPAGSRKWPAMRVKNRVLAGFPHLYYPSFPELVRRFAGECAHFSAEKRQKAGRDQ